MVRRRRKDSALKPVRSLFFSLCALALLGVLGVLTLRFWPHQPLPQGVKADKILIDKSERKLTLLRQNKVLKTYHVSLGDNPLGHKMQEGDERTPEGRYKIDWRNPKSCCHLSLHISYPNAEDKKRAKKLGVSPGGNIMIHGLVNGQGWLGRWHLLSDWTDGCIAVTNEEMREIWNVVPNGTTIDISP